MDKPTPAPTPSLITKNENFNNHVKEFVKELKVCTLDPARYLQRCIEVGTKSSGSYVAPNTSKCLANTGTLRNISITKSSFLSEKPDDKMITNIITARASGNYYNTQIRPSFQTLTPRVYTSASSYLTNPAATGADKSVTIENPKKLLLQMLKSAVIAAKKKHAAHLKSKKRHKKKGKHRKNRRNISYKNDYFSKNKKGKTSGKKSKHSSKKAQPNAANQKNPSKNSSSMINKMLEETEEMLRVTFLSNIQCFSAASTTPITATDLLEKSDMSQLLSNFVSKMIYCAKNLNADENRQAANAFISTTVTKKTKAPAVKAATNPHPRVSVTCKRKASSTLSVRKPELQGKFKPIKKNFKMPIGFGRPGKDDTEEAELAHCTIEPDPPSAISAPYRERNSSPKTAMKAPFPQESVTSIKSDEEEEKTSYTSSYLQRFRDPIQDHENQSKSLLHQYNSQITYVCPSTELNLKGKEEESVTGNGDKLGIDLAESQKSSEPSETSLKKSVTQKRFKPNNKKTCTKANISRALGSMVSKNFVDTRSLQQRKFSDPRNKFNDSVVQAKTFPGFRSNNKQILKKQSERKLQTNFTKSDAKPRGSSSFTSGGLTPISRGSRYQRQQRQFTLPANDVRLHAVTHAERRFFNRNEHLLFLARPNTRYAEDTKQRYSQVLDQYHVRNLNTIIFCNQAEESRLKKKREELLLEEFIHSAVKSEDSKKDIEEAPKAPNVSEASSSVGTASEHSFGTESDSISNLVEEACLEDIPIEETRRKSTLSIIQEEPEDIEDVDKFYMSIAKSLENYLNMSSLLFDGKEVECNETNAHGFEKIRARVIELDYRVSDRFQAEVQPVYADELKNEDEDNLLALPNPEITSEEPQTYFLSINQDFSLPLQLYKSMENVASNISTFITVFEGMELTLKGIQENCHYRTICSRHYITQDEIKQDCIQALIKAKETNSCSEKCVGMSNNAYVMRCELFFTNSTLPLGTKNLHNNFLCILYRNSEQYMFEIISDTEEKKNIWNKLMTVNLLNYSPNFIKKLDYSTVLEINPTKLLQKFTIEPNVLYFVRKSSKVTDDSRNENVKDTVTDTSMNMTECNPMTDNTTSLPVLNDSETDEHTDTRLSTENDIKRTTCEKQILTNTKNQKFGVEEGETVFMVPILNLQSSESAAEERAGVFINGQSIPSKELIDHTSRPLADDTEIQLDGIAIDKKYKNMNSLPTLKSSEFGVGQTENYTYGQSVPPKELIDFTASSSNVQCPAVVTETEQHITVNSQKCKCTLRLQTSECVQTINELTESLKKDTSNNNITNINKDTKQDNSPTFEPILHTTNDQTEFDGKTQENVAMEEISSGEDTLPKAVHLQQECAESCFDESQSNISAIDRNTVSEVKKNDKIDRTELKLTSHSDDIGRALKKATNHDKSSKAKHSHFSQCHNTHHMLWTLSSGAVKTDLNIKEFSGKATNAPCHDLTIVDSCPSLITERSILEERTRKLKSTKESTCSKQPLTPTLKLDTFSKLTQTDIAVEPKTILAERVSLKIGNVSSDGSSSRRKTKFTKSIKFVFLGFISLCAAGLLPTIPNIKPAVWNLINTYIMP